MKRPMKQSDNDVAGRSEPAPDARPDSQPGAAQAEVGDPLRGLADAGVGTAATGAPRPSLWVRIKRAFQYGSQGGKQ